MSTIGETIRLLRVGHGESQRELGEAIHKSRDAVAGWERGRAEPSIDDLQLLAGHWGTTVAALIEGSRDDSTPAADDLQRLGIEAYPFGPTVLLPIVGEIRCGPGGIVDERHDGTMAIDIEMFHTILPDLKHWFWLRIVGDSMIDAGYHDGGLALVHKQDTVESGEIAAVLLDDGESATLKRVIWHQELNVVELRPENEKYEAKFLPIGSVHIIGKTKGSFSFDDMKA